MKTELLTLLALLSASTTQATELIGHVQGLNKQSVVAEVPGVVEMSDLEVGDIVAQDQQLAHI